MRQALPKPLLPGEKGRAVLWGWAHGDLTQSGGQACPGARSLGKLPMPPAPRPPDQSLHSHFRRQLYIKV